MYNITTPPVILVKHFLTYSYGIIRCQLSLLKLVNKNIQITSFPKSHMAKSIAKNISSILIQPISTWVKFHSVAFP